MVRRIKHLQLWVHTYYKEIRTWMLVIIGVLLLMFSMFSIANQNRLIGQNAVLTKRVEVLSQQNKELNKQTKDLSEENQSIAKQTRSFTLCGFQLFAKYTRDKLPIQNLDLNTCTTDSQTQATNDTTTGGTTPSGSAATPTTQDSQNTTPVPAPEPTPSQAPSPKTTPNCTVDILFIHLGKCS